MSCVRTNLAMHGNFVNDRKCRYGGVDLYCQYLGSGSRRIRNSRLASPTPEFKVSLVYRRHCLREKNQTFWSQVIWVQILTLPFVHLFIYFETVSHYVDLSCPRTHYVDQEILKLTEIFLPLPESARTKGVCQYS